MTSFRDRTVEEFLAAVAARQPAPGGGAVAAVAVAAAAGLVAMAARYSVDGEVSPVAAGTDEVRTVSTDLADADADAYGAVLAAFRLARDDPHRPQRIRIALERAADVPLRIAEAGAQVARAGVAAAEGGNPNLAGDVRVGVVLAAAAARAAAELVRINVELGDLDGRIAVAAANAAAAAAAAARQVAGAGSDGE